jgi:LysR family hca operon transcriptional activator
MELRHLRYFVAVAEAGSLTVAAEQKLHTSQPSLSRQIRDLEEKVGAQLLTRRARGVELTPQAKPSSIRPARSYRRLTRQPKLRAGSLIPPSRASRWAF